MADFGVFAKLAIARNCGHFWSHGLRQNVVRWLHIKRILINWGCDLRRGAFLSLRVRPTFLAIFPWSPLWRISKNGRFRFLCQIGHCSELRALLEPRFAAERCRYSQNISRIDISSKAVAIPYKPYKFKRSNRCNTTPSYAVARESRFACSNSIVR